MRILLTGDDGYNSIGIRLLVHFLKKDHELLIAATKNQQSGVGGYLSVEKGGTWGETKVDGVRTLWFDGYPADIAECLSDATNERFDLVISGINWGANISSSIISSGTFSVVFRALAVDLAPRGIAISWLVPPDFWYKKHNEHEDLAPYLLTPGEMAYNVINLAIRKEFWGSKLLNINLPSKENNDVLFTAPLPNTRDFYPPAIMDDTTHTFRYQFKEHDRPNKDIAYDTGAILNGYISITPCQVSFIDQKIYNKTKNLKFSL